MIDTRSSVSTSAHNIHTDVVSIVDLQRRSDISLGEKLFHLKKNSLYKKAIGGGIDTWVDYLKQPEVNIPKSRAEKLIKAYNYFIIDRRYSVDELNGVPLYALEFIASKTLGDRQIKSLLEDAKFLAEKDFKEKYHDDVVKKERTYRYMVMKKCVETGSIEKVHNISSDEIRLLFRSKNL